MIERLKKNQSFYKISRFIVSILRLVDFNFINIHKLHKSIGISSVTKGKVVLAGSVGANPDMLMQTIVGLGFKKESYEVFQLSCDAALPICYNAKQFHYANLKAQHNLARKGLGLSCRSCTLKSTLYQKSAKFNQITYSELAPKAEEVESVISSINLDAAIFDKCYRDVFEYKGIHILEHAYSAVVRFFASNQLEKEPAAVQLFEAYLKASVITTEVISNTLKRLGKIDSIVCDHGIYVPQGVITEFCKVNSIRIITFNTGYRKNSFLFAEGDSYHFAIPADLKFPTRLYTDHQREIAHKYVVSRSIGSNDWVHFQETNAKDSIELVKGRTHVALFPNVLWDADIHFKGALFTSAAEWLNETLEHLTKNTNAIIHVRIHPGELKGFVKSRIRVLDVISSSFKTHPQVKIYDSNNEMNSYVLASACDVSVVQGSKIGIDLAALGQKVLVAGDCWTRDKKITDDPITKFDYFKALSNIDAIFTDQKRAQDFAYYLYFEQMKVFTSIEKRKGDPPFRFNSSNLIKNQPELKTLKSIVKGT